MKILHFFRVLMYKIEQEWSMTIFLWMLDICFKVYVICELYMILLLNHKPKKL